MHPLQVNVPPRDTLQYSVSIEPIIWNVSMGLGMSAGTSSKNIYPEPDILYTSVDNRLQQLSSIKHHMEQCLEITKTKLPERN